MINFLHSFHPHPILFQFGPISVHWYGIIIVVGMIMAIGIAIKLAGYYKIEKEKIIDLSFYLIIFGIIGARLYDVGLEWRYYIKYPIDIFKIWNGGLAIHGAIIAGLIVTWVFSLKMAKLSCFSGKNDAEKSQCNCFSPRSFSHRGGLRMTVDNFWLLCSLVVPGLSFAYAIGRWGNYFNQEIFGYPTNLPWGIPIDLMRRPLEYISAEYFHPTFLYESLGSFIIFIILILMHFWIVRARKFQVNSYQLIAISYLIMYSILRFGIEFLRIDWAPKAFGLRWPQLTSIIIIVICSVLLVLPKLKKRVNL